jgi:hypothetical protein
MKKITLLLFSLFFAFCVNAQVKTYKLNIPGGAFGTTPIPEYTKWYYFSFEKGDTIGSSVAVLENVNPGSLGTEVIDTEWAARTDWDIAFHATDIRTNSAASGSGKAGVLKIADTLSTTPLDDVFTNLKDAPDDGYKADEILSGSFIFGMTSMPPLRTAQLSASADLNGWAVFGMSGNSENPTVAIVRTADNTKFIKVYFKQFFGDDTDDNPAIGAIVFDYEVIRDASGNTNIIENSTSIKVLQDQLVINASNASGNVNIVVYSINGSVAKEINAKAGIVSIPAAGLSKGFYVVRVTSGNINATQKIVIK